MRFSSASLFPLAVLALGLGLQCSSGARLVQQHPNTTPQVNNTSDWYQAFKELDRNINCEREKHEPFRIFDQRFKSAKYNKMDQDVSLKSADNPLSLTDLELAALHGWTTGDYMFVNDIARGMNESTFDVFNFRAKGYKNKCTLTKDQVQPYVEILSDALAKLKGYNGTLWRGSSRPVGQDEIMELPGFSAFSLSMDSALGFIVDSACKSRSVKKTLFKVEKSSGGKSMMSFSTSMDEGEVLFDRNTRFRIVHRTVDKAATAKLKFVLGQCKRDSAAVAIEVVHLVELEG